LKKLKIGKFKEVRKKKEEVRLKIKEKESQNDIKQNNKKLTLKMRGF